MFKNIHKASSYCDESRIDFGLAKRRRNYRFKNKVLYVKENTILCCDSEKSRFWYKYEDLKYVLDQKLIFNSYTYCLCYFTLTKHGVLYRKKGPAVIDYEGTKVWYSSGKIHRDNDLPAIVTLDGSKHWYKYGQLHRDGGKVAFIFSNGDKRWFRNGKPHRDDGKPAVILSNGVLLYYTNGKIIHK
jgi:hypothetical protein